MLLETERLQLREMTTKDAAFILELVNTPDWHRFIGDRGIKSIKASKAYIKKAYLESYSINGYGAYAMIERATGDIIGSCGLYKRSDLDFPDIGFALLPQYGKKGFAFEAASALMEFAAKELGLDKIKAITSKENINSMALLNKIGLKRVGTITMEGETEELFLFSN